MEIETKVISTEFIKPSSPTPKSLQKHPLSFLDQLMPPLYIPFVYFYQSNSKIPISQNSNHLKISLSETLSRFYPLAGRLVGNLYVDCNDAGVPFIEAQADCDLPKVIYNPNPKQMNKFLPNYKIDEPQDFCMAVQVTYFRCGGAAVGIFISHNIADSSSFVLFANTWSSVARNGGASGPLPKFDTAAYFLRPAVMSGLNSAGAMEEVVATRIFTFSADAIALLQKRYSSGGGGGGPSREEAVAAFLWTRFVSATGVIRSDPERECIVHYPVNLRGRVDPDPALSDYHFRNKFMLTTAKVKVGDSGVEFLRKVGEAADGGFVAMAQAGGDCGELVPSFSFSSLCGLPLYEADFGWGRADWIGLGGLPFKNLAILTDTKSGGGIEALVHLSKQEMKKYEADCELQIFIETNFGADLKLIIPSLKSNM